LIEVNSLSDNSFLRIVRFTLKEIYQNFCVKRFPVLENNLTVGEEVRGIGKGEGLATDMNCHIYVIDKTFINTYNIAVRCAVLSY